MRFKCETKRHGRCFAETEQYDDHIEVVIWFDQNTSPKQIPDGGALQDATRVAINHFQSVKTKDGEQFEMHCSRITARWAASQKRRA